MATVNVPLIDASPLQGIADVMPNVPKAIQDAQGIKGNQMKLADMETTNKVHSLELQSLKTDVETKSAIANAIKTTGADPSTKEGQAKIASSLPPEQRMTWLRSSAEFNKTQSDSASAEAQKMDHLVKLDKDRFDLYAEKATKFAAPMVPAVNQYDADVAGGMPPSEAFKKNSPAFIAASASLKQDPAFQSPEEAQHFQRLDKAIQSGDIAGVRAEVNKSLEAQKMLAEAAKQRSTETHQRTMEGQGQQRIDATKAKGGGFEGENGELMAALAEKGISLPAGFRSKAQQVALLNGLRERNPNLSPDEIAEKVGGGQIDFGAEKKATQIAGGIAGKIRYAEEEITRLAPILQQSSEKLPRGKFVPWNKLTQMTESQLSDPDLKQFKSYMTTFSNAYDVLAARGGTDMEKRKHNREMFDTADSPQALKAVIDAVTTEAKVSGQAADASMKHRSTGGAGPEPTATGPDGKKVVYRNGKWVPLNG